MGLFRILVLGAVLSCPAWSAGKSVKAGAPLVVTLEMAKGWKLNDASPSRLTLFEGKKMVAGFLGKALEGPLSFPALKKGTYRLEGRVYFCGTGPNSVCLVKKIDETLEATSGVSEHAIAVQVGPP